MDTNTIVQISGFAVMIIGYSLTALYRSSAKRVKEGRQEQLLSELGSSVKESIKKMDDHINDVKENYTKKPELDRVSDRIDEVRKEIKGDIEDYKKHISDQYAKMAHVETLVKASVGDMLAKKMHEVGSV